MLLPQLVQMEIWQHVHIVVKKDITIGGINVQFVGSQDTIINVISAIKVKIQQTMKMLLAQHAAAEEQ